MDSRFKTEFSAGVKALQLARKMTGDKLTPNWKMSDESIALRAGLHVKTVQVFGAILVAIDQGLFGPCAVLSRVLFETALTQEFLCRRSVRLPATKICGGKLTQDFRTDLYFAHATYQKRKAFDERGPSGMRQLWKEALPHYDRLIADYTKKLGPGWMGLLKKSGTCTGLDVASLAFHLGADYQKHYRRTYRFNSESVHPTDATHYIEVLDGGGMKLLWYDFPQAHEKNFYSAAFVFTECMVRFMRTFALDENMVLEMRQLQDDFLAILEDD